VKKVRYEVDPHNRLVLDESGKKGDLTKFRKVLDGQFKTDEKNNLSYHIKAPLSEGEGIPHQVKLKGEWSLTDDHDLRLTMDKLGRDTFGDQITLQGEILDVNANSLLFAITTTTKEDTQSTYLMTLGGSWQADEDNRLSFHVKKEDGRHDILTLNGAWEINKNHEIIYRYEKRTLIRKKDRTHSLTFKGYWAIKDKVRISYVLSEEADSVFNFTAAAGVFREDRIEYEVGIGLTGRRAPATLDLTLFGKWNLKKGVGLIFEIEYENKRTRTIVFGAEAKLTDEETISFRLKDEIENKDIGVSLKLSHKILKGDGEAFLRILKERGESAVYAGAAWKW
jgi:hypothetical protein